MKIDEIDAYVTVIRCQSLQQAALSLGLTQPAITRRLQNFEEALGVELLDRNTRPLKATATGRIVYEQCRVIQRELNCAAMQAPNDPELMEALSDPPEMESIQVLKSALDQMRHFLWFYVQVMTSDSDPEPRPSQSGHKRLQKDASIVEKFNHVTDAALLRYFAEGKNRKPN